MPVAKKSKRSPSATKTEPSTLNGKLHSLRALKAFGLWAGRADAKDCVEFVKQLRARMEKGADAR